MRTRRALQSVVEFAAERARITARPRAGTAGFDVFDAAGAHLGWYRSKAPDRGYRWYANNGGCGDEASAAGARLALLQTGNR